jgi:BirA family biotin operon repressor/biotin-[acetyl-CoA-carboxylase] ligase
MNRTLPPFRVRRFGAVTSTNEVARKLATESSMEGLLIVADHQTRGRGRRGREWFSPSGLGLWATLILKPRFDGEALFPLGLAVGLAMCKTIESDCMHLAPKIQWPNDIYLGNRKVGGILVETLRDGDRIRAVLLGMGVNLNQSNEDFPPEIRGRAISIGGALRGWIDRDRFLESLLPTLRYEIQRVYDGGFGRIRDDYGKRTNLRDRDFTVVLGNGELHGRLADFGEHGELILSTGAGARRTLTHGEVVKLWR